MPIPIIAAVNGPAVGWGATMATLCDIVLMSEKSFMAEPHINIGLVVGDGISVAWPLYTSLLRAKELIFTGDRITPQQAVEFGLANRVVPPEKLMDEARALADEAADAAARGAARDQEADEPVPARDGGPACWTPRSAASSRRR